MLDFFQGILDVGEALEGATAATWNLNRQNQLVVMTVSKDDEVLMDEIRHAVWSGAPSSLTYDASLWRLGPEGHRQSLVVPGSGSTIRPALTLSAGNSTCGTTRPWKCIIPSGHGRCSLQWSRAPAGSIAACGCDGTCQASQEQARDAESGRFKYDQPTFVPTMPTGCRRRR